MPSTRRQRKYGGRTYRRGSQRKMTLSSLKSLGPVPARFITKHKYSTTMVLSSGNSYSWLFNLNSLYDPDRTGVGHQPYGYDQFATLYNRYRVIKCSYTISGIQSDNPGASIRLCAQPSNDIISYSDLSAMVESPRSKFITQGSAGSPLKTLHGWSYIPALMGRTKAQYMADDRFQAAVGSSPAELAILQIKGATTLDTGANINVMITLEYTTEWFDYTQQSQS